MKVHIALLTVTDTRTFDNDKSGAILVDKIKEANHTLLDRKICKDNKDEIVLLLKEWLKNEKIEKAFVAFCHIKLIQHSQEYVVKFEREVANLSEVLECYHISGDYDYLLKVIVKDMEAFREFMVNKLTNINHIGSTHSMFVISEVKHTTAINL